MLKHAELVTCSRKAEGKSAFMCGRESSLLAVTIYLCFVDISKPRFKDPHGFPKQLNQRI